MKKPLAPSNPWDDLIDLTNAQILYWGDAKKHVNKKLDDFKGNAVFRKIYDYLLAGGREAATPILHFSKPESGIVKFNGLCALRKLEISWFDDHGFPIQNYRADLTILDCGEVSIKWIHNRIRSEEPTELDNHPDCPAAWKSYKKGKIKPIDIWQKKIRSKDVQLPEKDSKEDIVLSQLVSLSPGQFEKVIVALFEQLDELVHHIHKTKPIGDGGFDFFGRFKMPRPLGYEIDFRGEVKRYSRNTAVDPKAVSRLVARLTRGEYGIFVTTSFFTENAQREVLDDRYPVHLISGVDLVNILKERQILKNGKISPDWLQEVIGE